MYLKMIFGKCKENISKYTKSLQFLYITNKLVNANTYKAELIILIYIMAMILPLINQSLQITLYSKYYAYYLEVAQEIEGPGPY